MGPIIEMSGSDGLSESEVAIHKRGGDLSPTVYVAKSLCLLFSSAATSDFNVLKQNSCGLCRQRKTKCDRQKPSCSHCIKAGADCKYLSKQKKHGLRAGYVAELERRLGEYPYLNIISVREVEFGIRTR